VKAARIAFAAVLLVLAVAAALLAADVRNWQSAVRTGDLRFIQNPGYAEWSATPLLPGDPARGLLEIGSQLAFRNTVKEFTTVEAEGQGFDNGYSESRDRAAVEAVLTTLAAGPNKLRDSEADNLLGILAYADSKQTGPYAPSPVERSQSDFQAAASLDPENADAKFNLEWLMRQLVAHGSRSGANGSTGAPKKGHNGAGGGVPGKGY
jgi:hypothetical protein